MVLALLFLASTAPVIDPASAALAKITTTGAVAVESDNRRELVVVGVVPLQCSLEQFYQQARDIARFKQGPEVLAVGAFPRARVGEVELEQIHFAPADLDTLRRCRVGNCTWRLPARAIERIGKEADWRQSGASGRVERILREEIAAIIADYQARGAAGLPLYADKPKVHDASADARELLAASTGLLADAPSLRQRLAGYPHANLTGGEDLFYWSIEKMGPKPVLSITHMTLHRAGSRLYVVSLQIYGNHYLDGMVSITRVEADPADANRARLEYIARTRLGLLDGVLARLRRSLLEEAVRKAMQRYLAATAVRLDALGASGCHASVALTCDNIGHATSAPPLRSSVRLPVTRASTP